MDAATPEKRDARPSAFSKLFYFMRPDKGKMALSLMMACIGETLGMVPYVVVAALAAGSWRARCPSRRRHGSPPPRLPARRLSSFSPGAPR